MRRTHSGNSWVDIDEMPEPEAQSQLSKFERTELGGPLLQKLRQSFRVSDKNVLAMNAIGNAEITSVLRNRDLPFDDYHVFSDRLTTEGKATNQKASGRCWLFAALNVLRLDVMQRYKLEDFEFSQAHLLWVDKLEKSNWFLENIIQTADEDLDSRLVQFLLRDPIQDGGQWDMTVSLIEKYGLMPKGAFPESAHSGSTRDMNWLLTIKLREFASRLRAMRAKGDDNEALQRTKQEMLAEVHRILTISLGEPPVSFDWNFRDKDKKFVTFKGLTPLSFYKDHVQHPLGSMISLIHDPRHEYSKLYTVEYLGNVVGGRPIMYVNLPIEELKSKAIKVIQEGRSVWFGCDVGKFCSRKEGVMDLNMFDYKNAYGVSFGLNKAERLCYGESQMTHAMAITGVHLEDGKPVRWRIENSWGEENGDKGYFCMSDDWFSEFVYQVVIDKEKLSADQKKILDQTPLVLPPWDPLGSLA